MTYHGSSIIDYFLSTNEILHPHLTIRDDLSLDSNHKYINFTFNISTPTNHNLFPHRRPLWHLRKLHSDTHLNRYQEAFRAQVANITMATPSSFLDRASATHHIESLNTQICEAVYTSLDQSCGKITQQQIDYMQNFWTSEMQDAFNLKEFYYRKWRKAMGLNCLKYWLLYQDSRTRVRRLIQQRKREMWRKFCEDISEGEYTKAISRFSKIHKRRALMPTFTSPEGPQKAADVMADHLSSIFSGHLLSQPADTAHEISQSLPFSISNCPITGSLIQRCFHSLPNRKAPGPDHLRKEMLKPILADILPLLLHLFHLCWAWSYTPTSWRVAQVVPIYKKDNPLDPSNYRPISLTSVLRKLLERCIHPTLLSNSPQLDLAQGGFRQSRGSLDQALCLAEICNILRKYHGTSPVLAFLDIKSAYDTVDRKLIWRKLHDVTPSPLLSLLRNLFDDVHMEVLIQNATSYRFSPQTGVLQGSILSPLLYSIYINDLPSILRPRPLDPSINPTNLVPLMNCLLYADDVVLISDRSHMPELLQKCEDHSRQVGYRWNPSKCVILDPHPHPPSYTLYDSHIPFHSSFSYLGIPFSPGGHINALELVENNTTKALRTMNQLSTIGLNPSGFRTLLSTRFYSQIIRSQLEYGLAICRTTKYVNDQLEKAQNKCIRRIFGGSSTSSIKVMLHLTKLPTMTERAQQLQAQFLLRSLNLPSDTLLSHLLPHIRLSSSNSNWYHLSKSALWRQCQPTTDAANRRSIQRMSLNRRNEALTKHRASSTHSLLTHCRPTVCIDPILWLPMTQGERSRCLRWRLGWLPSGYSTVCPLHPDHSLTKSHAIKCLQMHRRLMMPETITDPLSFLLNLLPTRRPKSPSKAIPWNIRWPAICTILFELDYLQHSKIPPSPPINLGQRLLNWFPSPPST